MELADPAADRRVHRARGRARGRPARDRQDRRPDPRGRAVPGRRQGSRRPGRRLARWRGRPDRCRPAPPGRSGPDRATRSSPRPTPSQRYAEEARALQPPSQGQRIRIRPGRRARAGGTGARDGRARHDDHADGPARAARARGADLDQARLPQPASTPARRSPGTPSMRRSCPARTTPRRSGAAASDGSSDCTRPHHLVVSSAHTTIPCGPRRQESDALPPMRRAGDPRRRLARPRRFGDHPAPPRMRGVRDAVHDLRARRGRPAGRHQARRGAPGVRSRPARLRPAQGPDPAARPGRRGRGRRRRDRGRAARGRRHRGAVVADRRAGHGAAPRHRPDRLHPVRQRLPELRGPRGAQARGRHALRRARDRRHRHARRSGQASPP